jgi:hypothetical protein
MIAPRATPSWRMGSQPKGVAWSLPPGHRVGSVVGVGAPSLRANLSGPASILASHPDVELDPGGGGRGVAQRPTHPGPVYRAIAAICIRSARPEEASHDLLNLLQAVAICLTYT